MVKAAERYGIELPEKELACAPLRSPEGEAYLGAMAAGINCAPANRQNLTPLTRQVFAEVFPEADLSLLYDVSHDPCKEEGMRWTASCGACSCTARAPRAPSDRAIPRYPPPCAVSASRC